MANLTPGFGPQGFEPSGGPQVMGAEEKLADMLRMMQGAPNSVLQMISRILGSGDGAGMGGGGMQMPQAPQAPQQWNNMFPMPPPVGGPQRFPGINPEMAPEPMRPSEPPQMPLMNPGFIRG